MASAILCVSSFFFTVPPVLLNASISSPASFALIPLSERFLVLITSQRIASVCLLSGLISMGT